jgi:hypothetical protein
LHFDIAQAASVGENGQLISFQRLRGKHVKLNESKFALTHGWAPGNSIGRRILLRSC